MHTHVKLNVGLLRWEVAVAAIMSRGFRMDADIGRQKADIGGLPQVDNDEEEQRKTAWT